VNLLTRVRTAIVAVAPVATCASFFPSVMMVSGNATTSCLRSPGNVPQLPSRSLQAVEVGALRRIAQSPPKRGGRCPTRHACLHHDWAPVRNDPAHASHSGSEVTRLSWVKCRASTCVAIDGRQIARTLIAAPTCGTVKSVISLDV